MNDFKIFLTSKDKKSISEITSIFDAEKIAYYILDNSKEVSSQFTPTVLNEIEYSIYLAPTNFEIANKKIESLMELKNDEINPEHFLFSFSNEEILELIKNSEEWNPLDVKLAKQILKDRNYHYDEIEVAKSKIQRVIENSKPKKASSLLILAGFLFSILGGLIGFFIAYDLIASQNRLPNGESVYTYVESDRKKGKIMIGLSITLIFLYIIYIYLT